MAWALRPTAEDREGGRGARKSLEQTRPPDTGRERLVWKLAARHSWRLGEGRARLSELGGSVGASGCISPLNVQGALAGLACWM